MYEIQYRRSVKNDLKKLSLKARRETVEKILSLASNPRPNGCKKLSGVKELYRIRRGDYRIIYSIENKKLIIIIVRVGHRRDIYRKL